MQPGVRRELQTSFHRQSGVRGAGILHEHVLVQHTGPQDRAPPLRRDLDAPIDLREESLSPLLHVAEIEEEGQDARAAGQMNVLDSVVVMHCVVLIRLVPQHLGMGIGIDMDMDMVTKRMKVMVVVKSMEWSCVVRLIDVVMGMVIKMKMYGRGDNRHEYICL